MSNNSVIIFPGNELLVAIKKLFSDVHDRIVNLDAIESEFSTSTGYLTAVEFGIGIG